jgi:DNA mismatch endonuclease (patch repair protein)
MFAFANTRRDAWDHRRMRPVAPSSPHATATMRANRGRDTGPEVALRAALHGLGLRFRKDVRLDLSPGRRVRPDIAFPGVRLAVFVDGCYWHGCTEHRSIPASNVRFWTEKIEGTRRRDAMQVDWLEAAGWTVLRIWEHEPLDAAVARVADTVARLKQDRAIRA